MIPLGKPLEQVLGIGALLLLAVGCVLTLWPFLSALLWAAAICFSTWPVYRGCERSLGGRRGLAAALMTLLVALALVAPFAVIVAALADNIVSFLATAASVLEQGPPTLPPWVAELPLVGESLVFYWESSINNAPAFITELKKLIGPATDLAVASGAMLGSTLLELGLSVFISFFFYSHGRQMAAHMREIAERLAGPRARRLVEVVGATVKGVIFGMIGTALAQALVAAIGFWIADVFQPLLLGFLTFVLSFVSAGALVWVLVALWLLAQGDIGWGIFVVAWGLLLVSSIDNFLRPYILGKTSDLPMVLGFFGFIGGILAFGFIGLFLGPTLLAVGYSLFVEWRAAEVEERRHPTPAPSGADVGHMGRSSPGGEGRAQSIVDHESHD
ncbi:AI-2E family transporter [Marinobacterium aestuariivivens]|uniref:AI-2E family transporter n=1 Tax=Marinobacterium aestuariivivens TaxID=1698799 RepID=A0ABW2A219_9GAMM